MKSVQQVEASSHVALAFSTLRAIIALYEGKMGDPDLLARSKATHDRLATAASWAADALQSAKRSRFAGAISFPKQRPVSTDPVRPHLNAGDKLTFRYPVAFTSLPEYSAHRDETVVLVGPFLVDGEAYDVEGDPMYEIEAADGWRGHAFASELEPRDARNLAEAFAHRFLELYGADVLAAVVEKNQDSRHYPAGSCATHDYSDSNMVMLDAWVQVFGKQTLMLEEVDGNPELELKREAEISLWNHAWSIAKAEELPRLLDGVLEQVWGFNDDDDFARLEGWALRCDPDGNTRCVASALPSGGASPFNTDGAAGLHVVLCAEAGSLLHRRAISRIKASSPKEHMRMLGLVVEGKRAST